MADYLPRFRAGETITALVSSTVTGGQLLTVTGNDTVGPTGVNQVSVGVAGCDTPAGGRVPYYGRGTVHRLTVGATAVAAGDSVEAAAAGTVVTHAVGTNDARVLGVALTGGASGATISVMEV